MEHGPPVSTMDNAMRVLRIVHLALTAAVPIYGAVAHVATREQPNATGLDTQQAVLIAFAILGVALLVVQPILRKRMAPPRRPGRSFDEPLPPGPLPAREQTALGKWFTAQLLSWSLTEAIAVVGLALAMVTTDPRTYYPFGAIALLQMLLLTPTRRDLEAVVRASQGPARA